MIVHVIVKGSGLPCVIVGTCLQNERTKRTDLALSFSARAPARSPWSNTYEPMIDDGTKPSDRLRELEVQLNDAFNIYRELYVAVSLSYSLYSALHRSDIQQKQAD